MAGFDVEGARKAGYSEGEIANYLAKESDFNAEGARKAGYTDAEIISHLKPYEGLGSRVAQQAGNLVAGAVRGAGSIGATLLWPIDKATDLIKGDRNQTLSGLVTGQAAPLSRNEERRMQMDQALQSLGADTDSLAYKGGRFAAEVAGTGAAGGALTSGVLRVAPRLAQLAPNALAAIESGGMRVASNASAFGPVAPATGVTNALLRVAGGATSGAAGAGLIDPSEAASGAAVGGVLPGAVGIAGRVGQAAGAVVAPFAERGREAIAGRTLQRFGITAQDVAGLSNAPSITGARRSLAEQITDPAASAGAARLQGALRLNPELSPSIIAREGENNAARYNTLLQMTGRDGGRDFAAAERAGTAGSMYDDAFRVDPGSVNLTPSQAREIQTLMRAPAIRSAMRAAQANASNSGANVGRSNASGSVEGLHQMKLALDDAIGVAENRAGGAAANEAAGLRSARDRLVNFTEGISPEYSNARQTYAQMSRPINQMDTVGELLDRGTANATDLGGVPRLMPNSLLGAARDEERLIQRATGRNGLGDLNSLLDTDQLNRVRGVLGEVDKLAAVGRAENGPGSGTASRLASTNLLQQIGLPEGARLNPLLQKIASPAQFAASLAEPRIQQLLLEITQNPARAGALIASASPAERVQLQRAVQLLYRSAPAAGAQ